MIGGQGDRRTAPDPLLRLLFTSERPAPGLPGDGRALARRWLLAELLGPPMSLRGPDPRAVHAGPPAAGRRARP